MVLYLGEDMDRTRGLYIDKAFSGGTPREIYLNAQKYHCRLKQGMSCLKVEKQGIKPGRYELSVIQM